MGEFCDFFNFEFENVQNDGIFFTIGCGSPVYTAAVVSVKGGNSGNNFLYRFFESVGRYICTGATVYASSTPAGSFFVPDVEVRGKSLTKKDLIHRRLNMDSTILFAHRSGGKQSRRFIRINYGLLG